VGEEAEALEAAEAAAEAEAAEDLSWEVSGIWREQ
jgi:hypothetical protein